MKLKRWNLKEYWKKQAEIPESIKKEDDFIGVIKKKSCRFSIGPRFLVLEFPRGVAQICGISKGESLFSKGKVTNIYICQAFFQKFIYIINSLLLWNFSGIAQYA